MAAKYVSANPACCRGLILWAAYPAQENDLSAQTQLRVLSIYATLDGLATPRDILNARGLLPAATRFLPIAGGNHAQFGWYGPQDGDGVPTLSRAQQQRRVVDATIDFLLAPD